MSELEAELIFKPLRKPIVDVAIALYKELDKTATDEVVEDQTLRVFRGSMLHTFEIISKTRSYYVPGYSTLELAGAITVIERGGRSVPSLILLHSEPDAESLAALPDQALTGGPKGAMLVLTQRVNELTRLLGGMDFKAALHNHEERITKIENSLKGEKTE